MSKKLFTGLAGEYYFCYQAALRGYHVALTRGNAPNVDVLISSSDGSHLLAVQVKTMQKAWVPYSKLIDKNHWEWEVKHFKYDKALRHLFAFVDLEGPRVFLVPPKDVADAIKEIKNNRPFFWIYEREKEKYLEKWERVSDIVGPPA